MANKDLSKLLKDLEAQGFRVERRKKGWMVYPPDTTKPAVVIHETLSDIRSWKNQMAQLKRSGYVEKR